MTDPAVDSCKGMWRRAADEGMGLCIWKVGKRALRCRSSWASPVFVLARDQPPISPSEIQLSGLFTALATVFVQAPNPFLSLFFSLSLLTLISCQRGSVIYGIVCWNFNLDSLVSLNVGRIITVSSGKILPRMNWDVQGIVQPKMKLLVIIYSPSCNCCYFVWETHKMRIFENCYSTIIIVTTSLKKSRAKFSM